MGEGGSETHATAVPGPHSKLLLLETHGDFPAPWVFSHTRSDNVRTDPRTIALHEAGHTLAYFMADVPIDFVTIDPAKCAAGTQGATVPATTHLEIHGADLWRFLALPCAGAAAEEPDEHYVAETEFLFHQTGDLDRAKQGAACWLEMTGGYGMVNDADALIVAVFEQVWHRLRRRHVRRAIERVAAALLEHGTLTHAQAHAAARCARWRDRTFVVIDRALRACAEEAARAAA